MAMNRREFLLGATALAGAVAVPVIAVAAGKTARERVRHWYGIDLAKGGDFAASVVIRGTNGDGFAIEEVVLIDPSRPVAVPKRWRHITGIQMTTVDRYATSTIEIGR